MMRHACLLLGMTVLAACARVPRQEAPVHLNTVAPLAGLDVGTRGGAGWPDAKWWQHYSDTTLNHIDDLGLASAPSLSNARARFDTARASVREAGANVGARVDLEASYTRQRLSDNGLFPPAFLGFHWYDEADLGLKASYTFDWWGKQHAAIESGTRHLCAIGRLGSRRISEKDDTVLREIRVQYDVEQTRLTSGVYVRHTTDWPSLKRAVLYQAQPAHSLRY